MADGRYFWNCYSTYLSSLESTWLLGCLRAHIISFLLVQNLLKPFTKHFLLMLVPFAVIAIISSSYISIKISSPLSRLESKINEFLLTEASPEEISLLNL